MATILAHIKVKPGSEAAFEALCRELYARSHAEEPDLLRYEYWRGEAPGAYYTLLAFPDYRTFMVHQTSAHHEAAATGLMAMIAEMRLEWLDPVPGASPLGPTRAQTLDDDASPLARSYAEKMPATIARWWSEVAPS